jgi:long-chain acyl-CoA synthetase
LANRAAHLFASAARHPDKTAILFEGEAITFGELAIQLRSAAASLVAKGIAKGTHVALMMPSCPDFIVVQQALFALGAVVSPLNIQYQRGETALTES